MPGSFPEISKTNSSILNLVRFLCCQGVVVGHALGFLHISHRYVGGLASYCVLLFFILSGFLISYSLLNKLKNQPEYNFWSFFKDRFFRIYPPFLGALIVVVLLDFTSGYLTGADLSIKMYMKNFMLNIFQLQGFPVANILYYQYGLDFFYFRHFGSNFPLWTISIEWWLYMFYGFFIFYFTKAKFINATHWMILIFLLITPVYYLFVSTRMEKGLTAFWFLGTLITYGFIRSSDSSKKNTVSLVTSVILILSGMYGYYALGYNGAALLFFMGLFTLMMFSNGNYHWFNRRLSKVSETLASYSYSLYLVHYPIMVFILVVFKPNDDIVGFIVLLVVSNIAAYLFARIFEANSKSWRLKYENYRRNKN